MPFPPSGGSACKLQRSERTGELPVREKAHVESAELRHFAQDFYQSRVVAQRGAAEDESGAAITRRVMDPSWVRANRTRLTAS